MTKPLFYETAMDGQKIGNFKTMIPPVDAVVLEKMG